MSGRRAARGGRALDARGVSSDQRDLLAGPCIEDWAPGIEPQTAAAKVAQRAWHAAVQEWADSAGMTYWDARSQARIATPWSRDYLRAEGRDDLADYYDGLRADHPDA